MTSTQSPAIDDSGPQVSGTPQRRVSRHVRTLIDLVFAVIVAAIVAFVGLKAIDSVQWPAFNSSNVTRALTTTGQVVAVVILVIAALLYRYGRPRWVVTLLSTVGISGLVTVTLGMPLGATRLYLFGLSADQQFRTEYLTRLTSSPRLADMTYLHLAPYYPAGWFWGGGRDRKSVV